MCEPKRHDHMVDVSGAAKVVRRDDEWLCRLIAHALLAQTRPDAAAHIEVLYAPVPRATWATPHPQIT